MNLLAENKIDLFSDPNGYKGFGSLGLQNRTAEEGPTIFATFISSAIGLITIIGVIWFIFIIVTGALGIISSGGDKQALEGAKKKITNGIIGLIVTISALFIINLIGTLIGIPTILNFTEMFGKITTP